MLFGLVTLRSFYRGDTPTVTTRISAVFTVRTSTGQDAKKSSHLCFQALETAVTWMTDGNMISPVARCALCREAAEQQTGGCSCLV